jgi:hypothetical protein
MPDRLAPEPSILVSYRPTASQAIGRGLYFGALCAALAVVVVATASLVLGGAVGPLAVLVPLTPFIVGGVAGLLVCRRNGVDVDDHGVHGNTPDGTEIQPWPRIVDLRTERRGGRTGVTAYLDSGSAVRLSAPYDGRLLARDRGFEHKYFTLRQIWETHRSWNISA